LKFESAEISLVGTREENQDRVAVLKGKQCSLMVVMDGMGGHADGATAAQQSLDSITESFNSVAQPIFDPIGFLHRAVGSAHRRLVGLGKDLQIDARPRATCAMVLLQEGVAYWAHVGDSRIYHLRGGEIIQRTRDHSHVELLLREGVISEKEVLTHPMRNFVECCLGGDESLPEMSVTRRKAIHAGDLLLVCSDGFWSGIPEADIASLSGVETGQLEKALEDRALAAVEANLPHADNTTVAAVSCQES
jgi:serine/threonine protein phosphatase PrpC